MQPNKTIRVFPVVKIFTPDEWNEIKNLPGYVYIKKLARGHLVGYLKPEKDLKNLTGAERIADPVEAELIFESL